MRMMHKLMVGAAACAALALTLSVEIASAKAGDPSLQGSVCRLAAAAPPLKLVRPTILVENGMSSPVERMSRRANYTPVPGANAREQASPLVLLERQSRPTGLMVGVGF
jgi:hypothetical protein